MPVLMLETWLEKVKQQHRQLIDLGLQRVREVARRLNLLQPSCLIITVGGTNGKGSAVAGLEACFIASGYRVGAFTSPYLYRFNELIRINGANASDDDFIEAFQKIEEARSDITLTQFEFNTLAALHIFQKHPLDIGILEVGLGGRLDAVNIIDADVSIVTSIAIDHTALLGNTREKIAYEKAGIFRSNKPALCGDPNPPEILADYAKQIKAPLFCQNKEFYFEKDRMDWTWSSETRCLDHLPLPRLALQNMSTVLMALELLQDKVPVSETAIRRALKKVDLPGRIQVIPGAVTQILDVSHNPAAVLFLANYLQQNKPSGKVHAVFSMLADKDIKETIQNIKAHIDEWYIAPLLVERGTPLPLLESYFHESNIFNVHSYDSIKKAYQAAHSFTRMGDCVLVFGSFYTIAAIGLNR